MEASMRKARSLLTLTLTLAVTLSLFAGCAKKQTEYIICSDTEFPPFEYYDAASGGYVGFDMDLIAAIAADQGFGYKIVNTDFEDALTAVKSGEADAVLAGMTITEERKKTFDFSDGYFTAGQIMVVRDGSSVKSLSDLQNMLVACKTETVGAEIMETYASKYGYSIQYYDDSPSMYAAVLDGVCAAFFEDVGAAAYAITTEFPNLAETGEILRPAPYAFAVKKGTNKSLISMFNKGLKNIKASGQYDELLKKYGLYI